MILVQETICCIITTTITDMIYKLKWLYG